MRSSVHVICMCPAEHMVCWTSVQRVYAMCDMPARLLQLQLTVTVLCIILYDIVWT